MMEALKAVYGYKDSDLFFAGISGSTDMGFIRPWNDQMDIIGLVAFESLSAHATDGYVDINSLVGITK
jgi:hypothetical protein